MNICETRTRKENLSNFTDELVDLPHEPKSEHRFAMYQISGPEIQIDESPISAVCKHCGSIYAEDQS